MAVELASAYVSIVPTTKGIQGALEKELSPLSGAAAKAGTDSGKALGSSFTGASGGLKAGVKDAEGAISKFKSSATGALESVGISAGVMKIAGVAGVVEFGLKSVEAFEHTALAARDLGKATGLSVEDASRWIGVAKDMGVNADSLRSGLIKVSKTLDNTKWKTYGIETRDAGGAARTVNDILLDTFDMLGKVGNETERARIGNDLFGKGYATLAPLIGKSRSEYEKMLGSVEKGQVINEGELKRAEAMHHAQEQLKQAFGEVTLAVGALVASLAPLISVLAKVVLVASEGISKVTEWSINTNVASNASDYFGDVLNTQAEKMGDATTSTQGYSYAVQDVQRATDEATASVRNSTNSTLGYSSAVYDVEQSTKNAQAATDAYKEHTQSMADDAKRNLDTIKVHWDILRGDISNDQSWANLKLGFIDLKDKITAAWDAGAKGAEDATKKTLEAQVAIDGQKTAVLDYNDQVLKLPQERLTKILALVDKGSLDAAQAALDNLTRNYNVNAFIQLHSGAGFSGQKTFATGGYTPGGAVWVGEKGRELVDLPRGSYVHTNVESMNMTSSLENLSPNSTRAGLHVDHVEVHNDTDADGFFRYANFVLAGV